VAVKKFWSVATGEAAMNWATASADKIKAAEPTIRFVTTLIRRLPILVEGSIKWLIAIALL
jgi:hypothetical protein